MEKLISESFDQFSNQFKAKFKSQPHNEATLGIIQNILSQRMHDFTHEWFNGRENSKLEKFHSLVKSKVKDELVNTIKEHCKAKRLNLARQSLIDLYQSGQLSTADYKAIDKKYIQALEEQLKKEASNGQAKNTEPVSSGNNRGKKKKARQKRVSSRKTAKNS